LNQPPQPPNESPSYGPPQYGGPQYPPVPPQYAGPPLPPYGAPPQRPKRKTGKILFLSIGGFIVLILVIAVATSAGHSSSSTPGTSNSAAAGGNQAVSQPTAQAPTTPTPTTPSPTQSTVEYIVTGNAPSGDIDPTVTYGPDGSDTSGAVPLDVSRPIPSNAPDYYAITVQLSDAGGNVTCEIKVNGQVIDQESAQGAYQIANCEISQDPFSGQWQNTNSGG
jgi:hypothetical protein